MLQTLIPGNLGNEYTPDIVSAPGETLQEILEDRQMTQTDLAERLGLTHKTVNEIVRGKAPITHETALGLETVLGIPAGFWNSYEMAYRESITRSEVRQKLYEYVPWLDSIKSWQNAVKMGWIEQPPSSVELMMNILRFFGVASPKQYQEVYGDLAVQWKRSKKLVNDSGATTFWLRRGELQAIDLVQDPSIQWNDYSQRDFERCLLQIRELTRDREPSSFVPKLQRICAQAGVAVVFVPELDGTRAGGATRWLSPVRALIQLSLRYTTNDYLWFYFYHEAAHILKHSKKGLFIEQDEQDKDNQEREADTFAQNILIAPSDYQRLRNLGKPTKQIVESFADSIGVDPGIVVGRLENDGVLNRGSFYDLKQQYKWEITRLR